MDFANTFHSFQKSQANVQWSFRFCPPPRNVFSCIALVFWTTLFESTYGRLLLEQYFSFRDLVTRPQSLLQVPSQLNDNSLLKIFFQRSIIWLHAIIIPLYDCYGVTFCIWSLYFVYGEKTNQTNKQIKHSLDWLKDLSKHS